eukprot:jgi/Tetstr1/430385/TSEL_020195.t1
MSEDDRTGSPEANAQSDIRRGDDSHSGHLLTQLLSQLAEMHGQMSHQYDELYSCQMELNTRLEAHETRSASEKMAAETAAPASRAATERAAFGDGRQLGDMMLGVLVMGLMDVSAPAAATARSIVLAENNMDSHGPLDSEKICSEIIFQTENSSNPTEHDQMVMAYIQAKKKTLQAKFGGHDAVKTTLLADSGEAQPEPELEQEADPSHKDATDLDEEDWYC